MDIPTVEQIDNAHDSGNLGDLYIWCQGMAETLRRQRQQTERALVVEQNGGLVAYSIQVRYKPGTSKVKELTEKSSEA